MKKLLFVFISFITASLSAQNVQNNSGSNHANRFEQLGTILSTPNEYRTASGAPGPKYWQQRCDYDIKCDLDEQKLRLNGSETVTYYNNSPDNLTYLWLQLDENEHSSKNNANYQGSNGMQQKISDQSINTMERATAPNDFGVNIVKLTDAAGKSLVYTINKTMMRVELPTVLKAGQKFVFKVDWNYHITDRNREAG